MHRADYTGGGLILGSYRVKLAVTGASRAEFWGLTGCPPGQIFAFLGRFLESAELGNFNLVTRGGWPGPGGTWPSQPGRLPAAAAGGDS